MAFRFWRRIRLAPGVTLNLSKSMASLSLGPRGAKYTISPHGNRMTAGLTGTGLFYTVHDSKRVGLVARIMHWVEIALTRKSGQATTSNLARPSSVILLRMCLPILASVFWLEKLRAFNLGPMTAFQRPIRVSPRLR